MKNDKSEDNSASEVISDKTGREFCYGLWNDVLICVRNFSAMGVKEGYLFHIRYNSDVCLGERGRKTSPLSLEQSIRCSKVSRIPSPSFANMEPLAEKASMVLLTYHPGKESFRL